MNLNRNNSKLPDDAVWVDDGTDYIADGEWLGKFVNTKRHFRLYDSFDHRFQTGHPDNRILFGVVMIDFDSIEDSRGGILTASPSMIGHLESLPPKTNYLDSEAALATYSQTGGSKDAFQFDSDAGFRLNGIQIKHDRMRWLSVRPLAPIKRCHHCDGILASPLAKQCLHCGVDWH